MTARYTITYAPRARRDLRKLPDKIATACVEFIRTALAEDPYRMWRASPARASTQSRYASARARSASPSTLRWRSVASASSRRACAPKRNPLG